MPNPKPRLDRRQLEEQAAQLAEGHAASRRAGAEPSPLDRLRKQEAILRHAYRHFVETSEKQQVLPGTGEWLLDNFYVVQQALRQVRENMPAGYYRRLPKLDAPPLQGYPRIYALARELIEYCQAHLDMDRVTRFVQAYQRVRPLTMGELWALPTMLRLGVLELLTQTVARVAPTRVSQDDDAPPAPSLSVIARRAVCAELGSENGAIPNSRGGDCFAPLAMTRPEQLDLAEETVVANCIRSLRTLETQDWDAFFESVSRVEATLRSDPADVYAGMDFETRDRYRKVVEELAWTTEWDEEAFAAEAVRLAEEAQKDEDGLPRAAHVGFYLVDRGRAQLERRLGYRPSWRERVRRWLLDHAAPVYLSSIALLTLLVTMAVAAYARASGGTPAQLTGAVLLALLPASVVGVSVVNALVARTVPPRVLPKMDFSEGIPAQHRTLVVVPSLLADGVDFLLHQLELHYLGNADPHLGFALLTDFADAPMPHMPEDDALLEQVKRGIERLNQKYSRGEEGGPFYLFHRRRLWNHSEDCWMGWERKRGKLVEFNRLLRGSQETSYIVQMGGDLDVLPQVEYVITLDADTVFPRGSARRLIGALAHPLNRAQFDTESCASAQGPQSGQVAAGYTVLQPRTEVKPTAASQTLFTRIFAGDAGLDLYTRAVSDVYQDLFGEGIYVGKGIYDVDAFERSLEGRVPENALLSHDLFEGIHGRAALATDVVLFEDYPPGYLSYVHRKHRWVRGDWQLLPWLFPRVPRADGGKMPNPLSALDRWKILDNLRRSLRPLALLTFLAAGWLGLPGSPLVWTLAALAMSAAPLVSGTVTQLARRLQGALLVGGAPSLQTDVARWLLSLTFLPYEALIVVDAIGATLVRLLISHQRLLQWTTAAHTIRLLGRESKIGLLWRRMGGASVLAAGLAALVGLTNWTAFPIAAPLLLAWLVSPQIAAWISRPTERERAPLSEEQRQQLRRLARRTWLYFERFVGPDDHWLPPDHFQEHPRGIVAHRTSPTNVGLMLLSTLSAYDLGYIGLLDLTLRLGDAFDGLGKLERYRGHFLNWHDTRSLKPLSPRYVSTVDSGNLAGCLVALRQGLHELQHRPILRRQRWQGFCDTLGVLTEVVERAEGEEEKELAPTIAALKEHLAHICQQVMAARDEPQRWLPLLTRLSGDEGQTLNRLLKTLAESGSGILDSATLRDLGLWSERIRHHLRNVQQELDRLLPWLTYLRQPPQLLAEATPAEIPAIEEAWRALQDALPTDPRLGEIPDACERGRARLKDLRDLLAQELAATDQEQVKEAQDWSQDLDEALRSARQMALSLMDDLRNLADQAEGYTQAMDFGFLFDEQRQVFRLGYRVDTGKPDPNHYDLLASEARIASLVAIAKGDVPQRHWLHLSRPISRVDGRQALLSWNGSMFEYLMPNLLTRNYRETLLDETDHAIVQRQMTYAHRKGVPWGISESGYYRFDAQMQYQYRGFGVPGLGRKRGLGEDLVIAPYASLLALSISPRDVIQNVDRLLEEGMLGHYGLYEAVDYTSSRLPLGEERAIVRSYMAHHQGMIVAALTNYLQDEALVRHFHADPRVRSVELLLQEQIPRQVPVEERPEETVGVRRPERERVELAPWRAPTDAPAPQAHFLSNGRYGVLITSAGGGYSSYTPGGESEREIALTRWRADTTLDDWGSWIYVQDRDSGKLWSAGYQPVCAPPTDQDVHFRAHQARFWRRDGDICVRTEIAVAPDDDVEIRYVKLTNHSDRPRRLRLTSYGEVVLAPQAADRRHPAFNKLFIESEYLPDVNALLFRRRPRSAEETPLYLAHLLTVEPGIEISGAYESDRARFLGRGRSPRDPAALRDENWLTGTTGATLDPIMALGQEVELASHETAELAYVTLAAESREDALALARRYRSWSRINRAFDQARSQSETELRELDLGTSDVKRIQQLLSVLLYPHAALRAAPETLAANRRGQTGLWPYAISGDYPILLARINSQEEMPLVRELLRAHAYWRRRQIKIDLVILNQKDVGYAQELHDQLQQLVARMDSDAWLNRRGGIFLLRAEQLDEGAQVLLETAARAVLDGDQGSLADQLDELRRQPRRLPPFVPTGIEGQREPTPPLPRPDDLQFDNGLGGFSADGREYVVYLEPGQWTPAPWINVIANADFGFLVSEAGSGYTWAGNSGENRLTPWSNDPLSDPPGEVLYLRDEETGEIWSPTPLPAGEDAPHLVRHGAGYSIFEHHSHGLQQRLRLFAAPDAPLKVAQLRLKNTWERDRRITATFYAEWVLGAQRDETQQYVVPEYDAETTALLARNAYHEEFGQRVAFVAASQDPHGLTADRTEFLGREGSRRHPAALNRIGLDSRVQPGLDPCAAVQVHIELSPGQEKEVFFLLGQGESRDHALQLVQQYRDAGQVEAAWEAATGFWDELLGTVTVETPDPALDLLLNRWLLYQALSCRLWARSALYQSSGAFGFRDQLQDVLSLLHAAPDLAREHILRAARHQFEEGDVLHWWHPPSGRGVRTRITDDLLWLPYVTAEYVTTTGDQAILNEKVPFRQGEPLDADEMERYGHYQLAAEKAAALPSLYEHCRRALEKGATAGPHGLPLMGAGDWNDGLNRVGIEGKGESVWLGWFLYAALTRFAPLCQRMGDQEQAEAYRQRASKLREALEEGAWDGAWYRRAYYDDGTPLGSAESRECQIASLPQSWAVLCGAGDEKRAERAMASVADRLVRRDDRLVLLFTPPFDRTPRDPGYIKGYPPGIRENGGQYTHAALWAAWAYAELGQGDRAAELLRLLNPVYHADAPQKAQRYGVEPYVVAADVYSAEQHLGRGGWTWYTGSSGWMVRLGLEAILGLRRAGDVLRVQPCIPQEWPGYQVTYRHGETSYRIRVENPDGVNRGVKQVTLDGETLSEGEIPLLDDGRKHEVQVVMG